MAVLLYAEDKVSRMRAVKRMGDRQAGFSVIEVALMVAVVGVVGVAGGLVYQHSRPKINDTATGRNQTTNQTTSTNQQTTTTPAKTDPYAGWKTYNDIGHAAASGISIKYPPDWHVDPTSTKAYGWSIIDTTDAKNIITVNDIFQDGSQTARQVWEACEGTDACNGGPDAKTLSSNESTINGLDAYTATIQTTYGTYHMTMIRGNKSASPDGTPYSWFTTYTTDQAVLSTFANIMASATFPN